MLVKYIALILPVTGYFYLICYLFSLRSCFYSKRVRHWMAFHALVCINEVEAVESFVYLGSLIHCSHKR